MQQAALRNQAQASCCQANVTKLGFPNNATASAPQLVLVEIPWPQT